MAGYSVVSLFSGAGFLDFGFMEHGFDVVWGCELVPYFAQAHNYNLRLRYGEGRRDTIQTADITKVSPDSIPKAAGIIGGPPCQDFSVGNANKPGVAGARGQLVWDYLDKVATVNPDFFLFENVEGLYKIRKNREEALIPLMAQFADLGYEVDFQVLNALDYGIPQDRSRVFLVGVKHAIATALRIHGLPTFEFPQPIYPRAKANFDWIDTWDYGTQVDEEDFIHELVVPYALTVHSAIKDVPTSGLPNHVFFQPRSDKFTVIAEGDDRRKSFKRLHRFRYSPTVAYGNNEVHLHPTEPRRISVREALRLQSVPDWYQFEEGTPLDKMFKMISNGVAFRLAELLADQIKVVLDSYYTLEAQNAVAIIG
ncbi:DNA cytosine methyltransferase [Sulfobacillus sp. hq2]|uniref:DNA cytosine methyltransferase n=1 Tax=Sulfobacillus TaxID=28033 RepID=UPI001304C228|nr:DNA cytosine methyltransferase [Sulfobacillus sp. hq2]